LNELAAFVYIIKFVDIGINLKVTIGVHVKNTGIKGGISYHATRVIENKVGISDDWYKQRRYDEKKTYEGSIHKDRDKKQPTQKVSFQKDLIFNFLYNRLCKMYINGLGRGY
jgi:hypothetical protein